MTAALEEGKWSTARPCRTLPPGETRYPLYRRLGGPQGRSGRAENLAPPGFDAWTVQPVVSRYTDRATRPTVFMILWHHITLHTYCHFSLLLAMFIVGNWKLWCGVASNAVTFLPSIMTISQMDQVMKWRPLDWHTGEETDSMAGT